MRGSWVGALCSWYHCPLESGGTLPLHGDAAQPPRLTPRMAEVATAHLLLQDNTRNQHGKTKEERREGGSKQPKDRPDAPPRELERDARGLELQSACPLAEHNRQILHVGEKVVPQHC